jgi:hypothetical protein
MKKIIELNNDEAKVFFLKGSSYFNGDLPKYLSFEPILNDVASLLNGREYTGFKSKNPNDFENVNYSFLTNKDGKFAWRPFELIHPVLYVSLVNVICSKDNWDLIKKRFLKFDKGIVQCCSIPVISLNHESNKAKQIKSWWQDIEQKSISYSLEYSHVLHTDVTDCYGSLYTHSIAWAIHGLREGKENKDDTKLLGNKIDSTIRAGRYGQTNGIAQGSILMDFIAEIVLGFVDDQISSEFKNTNDFRILRYRDDYRIFANSDDRIEEVLQVISQKLFMVGMKLSVSKTNLCKNVVEGSIKPDKLAGIDLQDLGKTNAKTIQKQLLRLHSFGQRYPNSGALRRLVSEFLYKISKQKKKPKDLEVQVAIATDIGFVSPATFPAIAGILSHLISLGSKMEKKQLWMKVRKKMARVPYNGYLDIWLQRVIQPKAVGLKFVSKEPICKIVNGNKEPLWESGWIASKNLKKAMDTSKIIVGSISKSKEVIKPEEIEIFTKNAWTY